MIGAAGELTLPRRARKQPNPAIHPSGDCGACSLGGALDMDVSAVYERFDTKGITHHGEMERLLRCAALYSLADRIIEHPAKWHVYSGCASFGSPAYHDYLAWFNHVRMAIDAGYYGLATIDFNGNGGPDTNHWVLICGARTEGCVTGKLLTGDILTSCSVRGERWIDAREFLKNWGGYDALFVRPAR